MKIAISLTIILILLAFFTVFHDTSPASVYTQRMNELSGTEQVQMETIYSFLNNKDVKLTLSANEAEHMKDVKKIFNTIRIIFVVILLFLLWEVQKILHEKKDIKKPIREAGFATIGVSLMLGLAALNFNVFWRIFHKILFPQGNWQFSPESTLISLFPESFFITFATQVILAMLSYGAVAVLIPFLSTRSK